MKGTVSWTGCGGRVRRGIFEREKLTSIEKRGEKRGFQTS